MSKKIKLKNLLEENFSNTIGGVVSRPTFTDNISLSQMVKEKYGDITNEKIDVKSLTKEISQYNNIGEAIFGKSNISKISEKLSWIASQAKSHTLQETDNWFDKITVNRNMKELTGLSKQFGKIAEESKSLQQRLGALYEDMGNILGRYYEIGETHVYGHDSDDIETVDIEENAYEEFFQKAMKKFGIKSPGDLKDDEKKKFFNYVDNNYKGKNEKD